MGILANSASVTMVSSAVDDIRSGYVTNERVTLTTNPTGTNYSWALGGPSSSAVARSALSAATGASVYFTPDAAGTYVVTVTVDSTTTYVLRLGVQSVSIAELVEASRYSPRGDTTVPAPGLGWAVYFSSTLSTWCAKDSAGRILPLRPGRPGTTLADGAATIQVGGGNIRILPGPTTLTANRQLTLGTTGAVAGSVIEIVREDTAAFTYAVVNGGGGGGTIHTFPVSAAGWAQFRFDGTNWALDELRSIS